MASRNNVVPIDLPVATKCGCELPARTFFLMRWAWWLRMRSLTSVGIVSAIQFWTTWLECPQRKQMPSRLFVLPQSKLSYLVLDPVAPLPWWCALLAYRRVSSLMLESIRAEKEGHGVSLSSNSLSAAVISLTEGSGVQSERFVRTAANEEWRLINLGEWAIALHGRVLVPV